MAKKLGNELKCKHRTMRTIIHIIKSPIFLKYEEYWGKIGIMPKQSAKQRIILVDDHEVVRLGLKSLLERHPQFDVVGEAGSAREAIEKVESLKPDVVVMDIRLPGTSGIEACEQIINNHPNVKVIMLTSYAEDEMLFSAI